MAFLRFLQYHNAVPIAFSVMLLGAGGLYAATNPEVVLSTEQTVISVDNTYIASKDFGGYTPSVRITDVTEDDEYYYVKYDFTTIDLQDYVWQDVIKGGQVMRVSKADLGQYRDLGLYVTAQLKQLVDRELARLRETQEIEKRNVRNKVVATAYSGLVGAFLDDTTEEISGYKPVVEPPAPPPKPEKPEPVPEETPQQPSIQEPLPQQSTTTDEQVPSEKKEESSESPEEETPPTQSSSSTPSSATSTPSGGGGGGSGQGTSTAPTGDTTSPTLQVLGQNPARVALDGIYTDLGAAATDNSNENLAIVVFVNDEEVEAVAIDTSVTGEWTVRYEATDSAGNTGSVERIVEVYDPTIESGSGTGGGASTTPASSQEEEEEEETSNATSAPSEEVESSEGSEQSETDPQSSEEEPSSEEADQETSASEESASEETVPEEAAEEEPEPEESPEEAPPEEPPVE